MNTTTPLICVPLLIQGFARAVLLVALCAMTGCSHPTITQTGLEDPTGNLHLIVSNQSFAVDSVDLKTEIDGTPVVQEEFPVGSQHTYKPFRFRLASGPHRIVVTSRKGEASLDQTFKVEGEQWAVVEYWYYPPSHYSPMPRHVSFSISHEKPMFD